MKIVIPGGSGQVGTVLARAFHADGHDVVVLSRHPEVEPWRVVEWDGQTLGDWRNEIDGCDVVINLAGRSVNCRYTPRTVREILESRVESTRVVGQAIAQSMRAPRCGCRRARRRFTRIASTAERRDGGLLGGAGAGRARLRGNFSIEVASAWERTFNETRPPRTRKVALRSAMTMSPDPGGMFDTLLGSRARPRRARRRRPAVRLVDPRRGLHRRRRWLIEHDDVEGPSTSRSPNPLPNADFMRDLREAAACGRAAGDDGCSRSARSSCARRRSWCSRAGASCPGGCSSTASRSSFPSGRRPRASSARLPGPRLRDRLQAPGHPAGDAARLPTRPVPIRRPRQRRQDDALSEVRHAPNRRPRAARPPTRRRRRPPARGRAGRAGARRVPTCGRPATERQGRAAGARGSPCPGTTDCMPAPADEIDLDEVRRHARAAPRRCPHAHRGARQAPERATAQGFGKRIGDGTTEAISRLTEIGVGSSLEHGLVRTERALAKLDDGTYGRCDACGQPIPPRGWRDARRRAVRRVRPLRAPPAPAASLTRMHDCHRSAASSARWRSRIHTMHRSALEPPRAPPDANRACDEREPRPRRVSPSRAGSARGRRRSGVPPRASARRAAAGRSAGRPRTRRR